MKNFPTRTRDEGGKPKNQKSNFRYNLEAYQVSYYYYSCLWSFSDITAIFVYMYSRYAVDKRNGYFKSI